MPSPLRIAADLYDLLRRQHLDYLTREHELLRATPRRSREERRPLSEVGNILWNLRLNPYPLDEETAAVVRGIVSHHVVPWETVRLSVEEWVYRRLRAEAIESEMRFHGRSREDAELWAPDLDGMREAVWLWERGDLPESVLGIWPQQFRFDCETHVSVIKAQVTDTGGMAGAFIHLPCMPLGDVPLSRVPLVDREWIDRGVLELCEACARLRARKCARLPAIDPHPLAWHRFFRPDPRWISPNPIEWERFEEARRQARLALADFPGRMRELDGRSYLHIDDYATWERRLTPGDLTSSLVRREGLVLSPWNRWIAENAGDGALDLFGDEIGLIEIPLRFSVSDYRTYPSPEEAGEATRVRFGVLASVTTLACKSRLGSPLGPSRTWLQTKIWDKLHSVSLNGYDLATAIGIARGSLFHPGGINELMRSGEVVNDRKLKGYYRPDALPPGFHPKTG